MADLDLELTPIAPNSAEPEVVANANFEKIKAAILELQALIGTGGGGGFTLPAGGTTGQVLAKASSADGDVEWKDDEVGSGTAPVDKYRSYRLRGITTPDGTYFGLAEIQFRSVAGVSEPMTGGTPIESGHYSSEVAANAFDGSQFTRWASPENSIKGNNSWVGYTFPEAKGVVEVMIQGTNISAESPTSYEISGSNDFGATWVVLKTVTGQANWTGLETRLVSLTA